MDNLLSKLPHLPNCCFCITVDTGSLIIGYLQLFGAVVNFITNCTDLAYLTNVVTYDDNLKSLIKSYIGIYVVDLLIQCLFIICSLCLIMGVHKKNPRLIFVWLMVMLLLVPLKFTMAIVYVAYGYLGPFFGYLVVVVIQGYFFLVINTVYQDVESGGTANW